jgi:toxin ParE1/3/4
MILRIHPAAETDLIAAVQWYEDRRPGLGERFLAEAVEAFLAVERHPRRFAKARYQTTREIRRHLLAHFPYSVVYEIRDAECLVVAIAHAGRRPIYWRDRLK